MKTDQLPLTETIFYLLLVFSEPTYGYVAIKKIEALSLGKVRIAAGTMYGAIENLLKAEMIVQISTQEERRKIYQTTDYGQEVLANEIKRMKHCVMLWESLEG